MYLSAISPLLYIYCWLHPKKAPNLYYMCGFGIILRTHITQCRIVKSQLNINNRFVVAYVYLNFPLNRQAKLSYVYELYCMIGVRSRKGKGHHQVDNGCCVLPSVRNHWTWNSIHLENYSIWFCVILSNRRKYTYMLYIESWRSSYAHNRIRCIGFESGIYNFQA